MTLAATTPGNLAHPNLTFSATTRPGITSPPYPNLIASAGIWTAYKVSTSERAIPTPSSDNQAPVSAQVIYIGASYRLGYSFGNAKFFLAFFPGL